MSCYIKRSDFFEEAKKNEAVQNCSAGIIDVCNIAISTPSSDVVSVVRCEDCISRDFPDEYGISCCVRTGEEVQPTDYCSKGQRMDEVTK